MREEELAALIDQFVEEAIAASEESTTFVTEATADDTLNQEEVESLEACLAITEETIALAEELIYVYYDLYREWAIEALELLVEIEEDLLLLGESADEVATLLIEVAEMMEDSLELAEGTRFVLEDNKITQFELSAIAQAGAIARAGLNAKGGPALQGFSSSINNLTAQVARGEIQQMNSGLGDLEILLPA